MDPWFIGSFLYLVVRAAKGSANKYGADDKMPLAKLLLVTMTFDFLLFGSLILLALF